LILENEVVMVVVLFDGVLDPKAGGLGSPFRFWDEDGQSSF
jgi:hypothetical protein